MSIYIPQNTGLVLRSPRPQDWRFGSVTGISTKPLVAKGWIDYLPVHELQLSRHFDSMACVTFSALNCIEILWGRLFHVEQNFSDRYIAKLSGTTRTGNWLYKVADTIRDYGLVLEELHPYPRTQDRFDWDDYYIDIDGSLLYLGNEFLKKYDIQYEWVDISDVEMRKEALRYAPLQVVGLYPSMQNADANGVIQNRQGSFNHAFTIVDYEDGEYWVVMDHYQEQIKYISWDYFLGIHAIRFNINKKTNMPEKLNIENNTLVQLVEGDGGFGFFLDDQIIIDDLAKILATDRMRNKEQKTIALTLDQWGMFDKVNLKGDMVNS